MGDKINLPVVRHKNPLCVDLVACDFICIVCLPLHDATHIIPYSDRIDMGKWGHRYISVPMYLCTDCWETTLELKQVLIELAVIMWLSIPLLVATQCKLQHTLNDHPTSHSDCTSKLYEAKCKILCKAIKEQPTPVEGTVKGNKHKHHFVAMIAHILSILCLWLR